MVARRWVPAAALVRRAVRLTLRLVRWADAVEGGQVGVVDEGGFASMVVGARADSFDPHSRVQAGTGAVVAPHRTGARHGRVSPGASELGAPCCRTRRE